MGFQINVRSLLSKYLAVLTSFVLAVTLCLPTAALAAQPNVDLENHTLDQGQSESNTQLLNGLTIDGVDAPAPGHELDNEAHVTSEQGVSWDIPVLWLSSNLQLVTQAEENTSYLPALAFFVPEGYAIQGDSFTVKLSDSLVQLFGSDEVISIYDARTRITYILPSSIRQFFMPDEIVEPVQNTTPSEPAAPVDPTWIDIYCAQSAVDALSEDDLNFLLDLIINKLQPQAVELLIEKFPAFAEAAEAGQLGNRISLYVYYANGDKDGLIEHEGAPSNALAYVYGTAIDRGGLKYCYLIGLDVADMLQKDDAGKPVRNAEGKFYLVREGEALETLKNTIIHEMFHAFMDDYNRTGMMGGTNLADVITNADDEFPFEELARRHQRIVFPTWFIEGSASSVENTYQYRFDDFKQMREIKPGCGIFKNWYDQTTFLVNYVNGLTGDGPLYADLYYSDGYDENGNEIRNTQSAYVMGYVAILYLSELKARATTGSAVWTDGTSVSVSSEKLRLGLDGILKDLHEGATLDQVIYDISPLASDGSKVYKDTAAFQDLFVKGAPNIEDEYTGDDGSLEFAIDLLNYLQAITVEQGRADEANGSILFDFNEDYTAPLDENKNASSDFYQIIESNQLEESTVPSDVALQGGGKSDPDTAQEGEEEAGSAEQQAAKNEAAEMPATGEDETVSTEQQVAKPEGADISATSKDEASSSEQQTEEVKAMDTPAASEDQVTLPLAAKPSNEQDCEMPVNSDK